MKRVFIITVFAVSVIVSFAQPAFGQTDPGPGQEIPLIREWEKAAFGDSCLRLSPLFGMMYGHAEEIVYPPNSAYSGTEFYSQLLWDIKPVFYYGLMLDYSPAGPEKQRGFFLSLLLKFGISGISGNMEDRDWVSVENDALTHYSIHDNFTREMFLFDMTAGFTFPFRRNMFLRTYIFVSYMSFHFSGMDGHGRYARAKDPFELIPTKFFPIDDHPTLADFSQQVISYTQKWLTVAPGISLGCFFLNRFFAELSFIASPLIFCVDLDEHKKREFEIRYWDGSQYRDDTRFSSGTQFRDYLQGGLFFEPKASLSFVLNKYVALSLEFSWRYIGGTKGNTFQRNYGLGDYFQAGKAGAGLSIFDAGLLCKVRM